MSGWWAMPMPSPRIICAGPARYSTLPLPTTGCSKSSCRWFTVASSTGFVSPTRRLRSLRPRTGATNRSDPKAKRTARGSMQTAIDRIMMTYDLLVNRSAAASAEARDKVTEYVTTLFEAGETDPHRLTVCGLTYLRELDGSSDPVKAGFTGL